MALIRNITIHQALNYYEKDDYYATKNLGIPGLDKMAELTWGGSLSKKLGLVGKVDHETLKKVFEGEYPNGKVLRGRREKNGNERKRVGFDITFEAPKSVSIAALEGGDHKLIELHREAELEAIEFIQSRIGCRRGKDGHRYEQTGEGLYMRVLHGVNRNQEPHLHGHCVFANVTQNFDGELQRSTTDNVFACVVVVFFVVCKCLVNSYISYQCHFWASFWIQFLSFSYSSFKVTGFPQL